MCSAMQSGVAGLCAAPRRVALHGSIRDPHIQRGSLAAPPSMAPQLFMLRRHTWRGKKGLSRSKKLTKGLFLKIV
jgi:hypothetical protein